MVAQGAQTRKLRHQCLRGAEPQRKDQNAMVSGTEGVDRMPAERRGIGVDA
jgi:hypothetical protein